jgi:hypothetical protein
LFMAQVFATRLALLDSMKIEQTSSVICAQLIA